MAVQEKWIELEGWILLSLIVMYEQKKNDVLWWSDP